MQCQPDKVQTNQNMAQICKIEESNKTKPQITPVSILSNPKKEINTSIHVWIRKMIP